MQKKQDQWFHENTQLSVAPRFTKIHWKIKRGLFSGQSKYQAIDFYESYDHGIIFALDKVVMTTERDEFIYHEALAHTSLYTHPQPQRVLIIGGGDYGTAREVLKHAEVKHLDLCEIDPMVLEKCKDFFAYAQNVLSDKRIRIIPQDGHKFLQTALTQSHAPYDIILIDSTDPIGEGKKLFKHDFIKLCRQSLDSAGIISTQSGSPFYNTDFIEELLQEYHRIFPAVDLFTAPCHSYPGGYWAFIIASKKKRVFRDLAIKSPQELNLSYYNPEIHKASFALPNYIRKRIKLS